MLWRVAGPWLALVRLELPSGRPTGVIEGTGHMIDVSPWGDLFVAGLEGTVFQWTPLA